MSRYLNIGSCTLLLLFLGCLLSCGRKSMLPLSKHFKSKAIADISVDSAAVSPEIVQIMGTVHDALHPEEPLIFAGVVLMIDHEVLLGTETDFTGNFDLTIPIEDLPGSVVEIEFFYPGYQTLRIVNLTVRARDRIRIHTKLPLAYELPLHQVRSINIPLIDIGNMTSGQTFTHEQIRRSPTRGR